MYVPRKLAHIQLHVPTIDFAPDVDVGDHLGILCKRAIKKQEDVIQKTLEEWKVTSPTWARPKEFLEKICHEDVSENY